MLNLLDFFKNNIHLIISYVLAIKYIILGNKLAF